MTVDGTAPVAATAAVAPVPGACPGAGGGAWSCSASVRRSASPISYVGSGANAGAVGGGPPYLILQGSDDQGVRPRHSQAFARRLEAAGVPARLVLVQGADHGLNSPSQRPTPGQLTQMVTDFLTRSLASR